jgi:hypothetical protein
VADRVQLNVRVQPELVDQLRREAERRQVSVNYLVESAIAGWLEEARRPPHVGQQFAHRPRRDHWPVDTVPHGD